MKIIKKIIKNIFNLVGLEIKKKINNINFDKIYQKLFSSQKKLIIFDVGANQGQSIERFLKIFPNCEIHSFEPINEEFQNIKEKYQANKKIKINNFALGDVSETKILHIAKRTGVSSFFKINLNTKWLRERSRQYNVEEKNFQNKTQTTTIKTIDDYVYENKIDRINILKIDTQGYEVKVLAGARKTIESDILDSIETEIMFDDVYETYLTFTDLEKNMNSNFRFSGIKTYNNNLFEGINFFAEVLYINKKKLIKY